ncbi:MAG TPA: zf-HC2 domain-containing protein [Polyangia bacterium]|nr:zf-HC2 domain-containing protein [Polyangia bacterium]
MTTCVRGGAGLSDERLSAYGDGDLPAVELASVREHLEACGACARRAEALSGLARAARALAIEAPEPPPTLWASIEGALDEPPRAVAARSWGRLGWRTFAAGALAGAAFAVLALLAVGALNEARERSAALPHEARGDRGPASGSEPGPRQIDPLLAEAEAELARAAAQYEHSIEKLRGLVAREEAGWSPDARARYADRLARLDEAIARSREAARRTPADSVGHEQLFAAYQDKITFLAEAVQRGGGGASPWGEGGR